MAQSVITSDLHVIGQLSANSIVISTAVVTDDSVEAGANIAATKLEHQYQPVYCQEQPAYSHRHVIHVAFGDGNVVAFRAGSVVPCAGDSTVTVDLLKNGSTILVTPITLDNSNAARVYEGGTVNTVAYVAGDCFEVAITVSAGTGTLANGVFAQPVLREVNL